MRMGSSLSLLLRSLRYTLLDPTIVTLTDDIEVHLEMVLGIIIIHIVASLRK